MSIRSELTRLLDDVFDRRVYSDRVPAGGFDFPYAGILDNITETAVIKGDQRTIGTRRVIQVDVWQRQSDEDEAIVDATVAAIDGQPCSAGFRFAWEQTQRLAEDDADIAHHVVTFAIARLTTYAATV